MSDESVMKWPASKLAKIIQGFGRQVSLMSLEMRETETLLRGCLYLLIGFKGKEFSLTTEELIDFVSLENLMTLAVDTDERLASTEKIFIRLMLKSLPGFNPGLAPDKQNEVIKNAFCNVHLLLLSCHADMMTPEISTLTSEVN